VPSDDLQGVEIGAGFAQSMEESTPKREDFPDRIEQQDLDLEQDIHTLLRYNSETTHLDDVRVTVRNGSARLQGTVMSEDDLGIVELMVQQVEGIRAVRNELRVAGP
jgi:osmotically-inducible protein OsmY